MNVFSGKPWIEIVQLWFSARIRSWLTSTVSFGALCKDLQCAPFLPFTVLEGCRSFVPGVGFAPTGTRRLITAHTHKRH